MERLKSTVNDTQARGLHRPEKDARLTDLGFKTVISLQLEILFHRIVKKHYSAKPTT